MPQTRETSAGAARWRLCRTRGVFEQAGHGRRWESCWSWWRLRCALLLTLYKFPGTRPDHNGLGVEGAGGGKCGGLGVPAVVDC